MLLNLVFPCCCLLPGCPQVRRLSGLVGAFPLQGRPEGADPPVQECAAFVAAAVKWLRRWVVPRLLCKC